MMDIGNKGRHNSHGLTVDDVYMALQSIRDPRYVYIAKEGRYAIISSKLSHFNLPLLIVIEVGAGILGDVDANINKIITIYPKDDIDGLIEKLDKKYLLYKK